MAERIAAAFAAGLVSIAFPCVLPLVPGYLSAISAVEVDRLGERGAARRVVAASVPFALGFTVVFVVLGAGAAALGGWVDQETRTKIAGFVLVVLGLAFMGLLPWPERVLAPGALTRARASGSRALLGAAFAVCAAPCVGVVLGAILALAADSRTVFRGCILLAAYSFGITVAFVVIGIAFTRAMAAFRWVRDHYDLIRYISGGTLVVLGLLLFFNRDWWLRVVLNRALDALGLGGQL
ncbi:MAG TPA: cytochrome c biogenesis protein CcdA [Gaiellaceae bacterium]|jgi:cytochrome c-type biogenesis protein|nr:cytochrome c biogenesis protein CcdA [Gaiellaceae bacterium]